MLNRWIVISTVALLGACSSLPDLDRAKAYRDAGEFEKAERELQQLSDFGLVEASFELAELYYEQNTPETDYKAMQMFTQLLGKTDRVYASLGRLYARKAFNGGDTEAFHKSVDLLKRSHEKGDEFALRRITGLYLNFPQYLTPDIPIRQWIDTRREQGDLSANYDLVLLYKLNEQDAKKLDEMESLCLEGLLANPHCFEELAEIYAARNDQQKIAELDAMVRKYYDERKITADYVYTYARYITREHINWVPAAYDYMKLIEPVYAKASIGRARLLMRFNYLDNTEVLLDVLNRAADRGITEAYLLLGRLYYEGKQVPQLPETAVNHLMKVRADYPAASYMLGQIYRLGWLGDSNFDLAVQYLLESARGGYGAADRALAEMFYEGKGIRKNMVYAYSFANFAKRQNDERGEALYEVMEESLDPEVKERGLTLFSEELKQRKEPSLYLDEESEEFALK